MKKLSRIILSLVLAVAIAFSFPVLAFDFSQGTGLNAPGAYTADAASTVKLNKTSIVLVKGKSATLKVLNTSKTVKWTTSDKTVATVSKGKVTAKKKGSCTITATVGTRKYTCKVRVNNRLGVSNASLKFTGYGTKTVIVKFINNTVSDANVNIDSYDSSVVKCDWIDKYFDENGNCSLEITPVAYGKTTVKISNNVNTEVLSIVVDTTGLPHLNYDYTSVQKNKYKTLKLLNNTKSVTWCTDSDAVELRPDGNTCRVYGRSDYGFATVTAVVGKREYTCYFDAYGPSPAELANDQQALADVPVYKYVVDSFIGQVQNTYPEDMRFLLDYSTATTHDLDKDGTPELILGYHPVTVSENGTAESTSNFAIYSSEKGETETGVYVVDTVLGVDTPENQTVAEADIRLVDYEGKEYIAIETSDFQGDDNEETGRIITDTILYEYSKDGLAAMHRFYEVLPFDTKLEEFYDFAGAECYIDGEAAGYDEFSSRVKSDIKVIRCLSNSWGFGCSKMTDLIG